MDLEKEGNQNDCMNVLFIPQWYPTSVTPNAGAFNLEIAKAISKIAEVKVLTVHFSKNDKFGKFRINKRDSSIEEFEYFTGFSPIPKTTFLFITYIYKKAILKYLETNNSRPDVIHTQDITAYFVLKALNKIRLDIPVVVSQHASVFLEKDLRPIIKRRFKYIFRNASIILPANKNADKEYRRFGLKANVKWLPNIIDTNIFKPDPNIKREKIILHISGFTRVKRVEDVITSFKKIYETDNDFRLILIGEGVNRIYYEKMASTGLAKGSFQFLGFLNKSEIANHLQRASCFVFPSTFETFGVVLIEAAATGCPIVTTYTGGIPNVLGKEEAHFVEVGDTKAITDYMLKIINKRSKIDYNKVSENIREKFSEEKISQLLEEIYEEVIL